MESEIQKQSERDELLKTKLSEKNHHVNMRKYYEGMVVSEDNFIRKLNAEIEDLRMPFQTGSAYDVPELNQTWSERLIEGLDRILGRTTPG